MTDLKISEAGTVQFPMVRHAAEIGWTPLAPEVARQKRGGEAGMLLRDELEAKLTEFNPWLNADAVRSIIETVDALPATIEGNREMLKWLRGEHGWYDEDEKRHRPVKLLDFETADANAFHVSWEWTLKPPARKGNRADVMFVINGVPVCIVEHKNPKDGDAIERGIIQLRRYELETPELIGAPQLFNVTHLIDYWYGVTWQATRRDMARWKQTPDETYRFAVQAFFERTDFLRTLQHWILFYVQDSESRKSVLRQHQRRAIDAVVARCADPEKTRGLVWHTQGSGKTFTLLTAARLILEQKARFQNATVILVVDRTELEGQLKGWIDGLLGEMQQQDIAVKRADTKAALQNLLDADFRGLIISMIHKFEAVRKDSVARDNVYVFIDEAHRSVAKDLGSYLMGAVPNATIIGFTGTPIAKTHLGEGTFKIFGYQDDLGYLDKYPIKESIEDETTLPIKHVLAPSEMTVPVDQLDQEFFDLAALEDVTDIDELSRVLDRAINLRAFLKADERVKKVAAFVAEHFQENVPPLGYKAFLVAVDREACAKYKRALDKLLPAEWSEAIYTENAADVIDRPLVAELQLSEQREDDVRLLFKKAGEEPKILIVTDKLLTGYDAPLLYCLYLDKPMRDHVLLQAVARVNRPYSDAEGIQKKIGLVVDFVGVLRELKKALQFDSADVSGVIEDLDLLMRDFLGKIAKARADYLDAGEGGDADERLERLVYGRFLELEPRKAFFEAYKDVESLWEILSPSKELVDHIPTYQRLAQLYAAVRNAYAPRIGFVADLAYKTRAWSRKTPARMASADSPRLSPSTPRRWRRCRARWVPTRVRCSTSSVACNTRSTTIRTRRRCFSRSRTAPSESSKGSRNAPRLACAAMDLLAALAAEKDAAERAAKDTGLSPKGVAVYWRLRDNGDLLAKGIDPQGLAREIEQLLGRFPNARVNSDEQRQLRAALYRPLVALDKDARTALVELILAMTLA